METTEDTEHDHQILSIVDIYPGVSEDALESLLPHTRKRQQHTEEERRQRQMREREAALQQVEAMKRDLSMGNAQQRVPHILNTVPHERRADEAKSILQKLGRKVLKSKLGQGWVQQLFAAAGEDP